MTNDANDGGSLSSTISYIIDPIMTSTECYSTGILLEFVLFDNDDKSRKDHVVRLGEMWEGFGVYKMNIICNLSGLYFALS